MYEEIYEFGVESALKCGQLVRLIDRAQGTIINVNSIPVEDFYKMLDEVASDKLNRYEFYVRKEVDEDAD